MDQQILDFDSLDIWIDLGKISDFDSLENSNMESIRSRQLDFDSLEIRIYIDSYCKAFSLVIR